MFICRLKNVFAVFCLLSLTANLAGCVMSEEIKRIDAVKKNQKEREQEGSTNLTGEVLFVRSCNTCHPGGQAGMGPSLENIATKFPQDAQLKQFIRKGKGIMPAQPVDVINDQELDNLIGYLRQLEFDKPK